MILTPHIVVGAAIGAKTHNLGLIVILGILSHLILDRIPHWDYPVLTGIKIFRENKKKSLKNFSIFFKIIIDGIIGLLIVLGVLWYRNDFHQFTDFKYLFSALFGIFISTLPDIGVGFSVLFLSNKISQKLIDFHRNFFHYKKREDKPTFLNVSTEILIVIISIIMFFF